MNDPVVPSPAAPRRVETQGALATYLILAAGLLVAGLIGTALYLTERMKAMAGWVAHTNQVRSEIAGNLQAVLLAETGQRAYLLTGRREHLRPLADAKGKGPRAWGALEALVQDNPAQQVTAQAISRLAAERLARLDTTLGLEGALRGSHAAGELSASLIAGQELMDRLRTLVAEMDARELELLKDRSTALDRVMQRLVPIIAVAGGLLLVLGAAIVALQRDIRRRSGVETQLVADKMQRDRLILDLARINRDLDQFAYVASHDLKAPLRGIGNIAAWLQEDLGTGITAQTQEHLRLLKDRAARLEGLIDGMLAYARAGRQQGKPQDVQVTKALQDLVELLAVRPPARVVVDPGMPTITTDPVLFAQVFGNLISNGLKHSRRADVVVNVECKDERDHWHFVVRDNGRGIAPQFHARIWEIFQTLESRDTVEGTGIGLAIVRKIVERIGGTTSVESTPPTGTIFHVLWPRHTSEAGSADLALESGAR